MEETKTKKLKWEKPMLIELGNTEADGVNICEDGSAAGFCHGGGVANATP